MIEFQKSLRADRALYAYNNNIVEFTATKEDATAIYCDIIVNGTLQATIYPVGTKFWYNFKDIASSLVNRNSFQDLTNINLVGSNPLSFVVDETPNAYLFTSILFSVRYDDGLTENQNRFTQFLRNVRKDKTELEVLLGDVLTPNLTTTNIVSIKYRNAFVKYWEGFPFSVGILSELGTLLMSEEVSNIQVVNFANSLSYSFTGNGKVNRLVFSDGRTDVTIEILLPLVAGMNRLRINGGFLLDVEKVIDSCGVYVKWLNPLGGWSYWLFTQYYEENIRSRSNGEINNDFKEVSETTSTTFDLGKSVEKGLNVTTDNLNKNENLLFRSILESPKVYLFTGRQYSKNTVNDWMSVQIRGGNFTTKNFKQDLVSYNLTLELPKVNTMTL